MDLPAGLASTRLSRIVAPVVVGRGTQATAAAAAPPPARPIELDAPPPALAPPHMLSEQQLKSFVETGFPYQFAFSSIRYSYRHSTIGVKYGTLRIYELHD